MTLLDSIRNLIYIKVKINYKYEHLFLYTSQDNVKTKRLEYGTKLWFLLKYIFMNIQSAKNLTCYLMEKDIHILKSIYFPYIKIINVIE